MNDDEEKPTRHVEITYVGHQIRNLDKKAEQMPMSLKGMKQLAVAPGEEGAILLVYRFIRNYTKGVNDSWTINAINHQSLKDLQEEIFDE